MEPSTSVNTNVTVPRGRSSRTTAAYGVRFERVACWNATVSRVLDRLSDGPPLVADGGMGVLVSSAVPRLRCPEEANLRSPESVLSLHLGFIRAGADLIETNTFGANRRKLAGHYLEDDLERINEAAVKIARDAREVSGRDVLIAGAIGPLGEARPRR